mmetsp:Transcript_66372/g.158637  ORF Transcript_66372/g.158637 Transcript_66372/m.158637 type:complete len:246 (+) Transcript_66372:110-847(+)
MRATMASILATHFSLSAPSTISTLFLRSPLPPRMPRRWASSNSPFINWGTRSRKAWGSGYLPRRSVNAIRTDEMAEVARSSLPLAPTATLPSFETYLRASPPPRRGSRTTVSKSSRGRPPNSADSTILATLGGHAEHGCVWSFAHPSPAWHHRPTKSARERFSEAGQCRTSPDTRLILPRSTWLPAAARSQVVSPMRHAGSRSFTRSTITPPFFLRETRSRNSALDRRSSSIRSTEVKLRESSRA